MTPASNGQGEDAEIPLEARQLAGLIQCTPGQSSGFAISEEEAVKRIHEYAQAVAKKAVEAERERSNRLERQLGFANIYIRHLHSDALTQLARAESAEATAALLRAKEPESAESVPPERSV